MAEDMAEERQYDIVLWGATGCTGRLAARYFHRTYGQGSALPFKQRIRWAIAGRNQQRLEAIRDEIGAPDLDIILCNGGDATGAALLARRTLLVCSTVAPAARHATEMIAACIDNGTHYCDLSGELHWLRSMIDVYHERAVARGVRVVNACGFDSIPSEYGVQVLQEAAYDRYGMCCKHITNCFNEGHIAVGGGSFQSGKGVMEAVANDPEMATLVSDPYSLNPADKMDGPPCPDVDQVQFDEDFEQYLMPFPIGQINARIVRRTHALMGYPFGKDFTYREAKLAGVGGMNKIKARIETFFTKLFVDANPNTAMGKFLLSLGPELGNGPSDDKIKQYGPFSFSLVGTTPSGNKIRGWAYSEWDPGHGGTAAMLCDAAFCLAKRQEDIAAATDFEGGFLTPYAAMGNVLREQLSTHAGVYFGVGDAVDRSVVTVPNPWKS